MFSKKSSSENLAKFSGNLQLYSRETALVFQKQQFANVLKQIQKISGIHSAILFLKKAPAQEFKNTFLAEHLLTTTSCEFYLWIFRNFSEHLIYRSPPWGCLFHVQVTGFQPAYTIKNYFIGTFQAFFTRTKLIRS